MPPDGLNAATTVLCCAAAGASFWLATDAGLMVGAPGRWDLHPTPPFAVTAAILPLDSAGRWLMSYNIADGVAYSFDYGVNWSLAWLDEISSPITCMAVSPPFDYDRVILAGTSDDGMIRSTDGGRRWRIASFGLSGFTLLALACAPDWRRREDVFAATDEGVYRSPNGGRAWKRADRGLEGVIINALAVSPAYCEGCEIVLAASENGPIFRSQDAGRSWIALRDSPEHTNALWIDPNDPQHILAGAAGGVISCSLDGGAHWSIVVDDAHGVLALGAAGRWLYAARYGGGLLLSGDNGMTWRQDLRED